MLLTAACLRERLDYDPKTGLFHWKAKVGEEYNNWNARHAGKLAGSINGKGYVYIAFGKQQFRAHRLAWLYVHGEFPKHEIDHIDRCRSNNRIANLRDVTAAANIINRTATPNRSGVEGVKFYRGKTKATWSAQFRNVHLGTFETADAAIEARNSAIASYVEASL